MPVSPVVAKRFNDMKALVRFGSLLMIVVSSTAAELPPISRQFLDKYCFECHDTEVKKGGLDLTVLKLDPANSTNFNAWVLVHDRVNSGEMPPKKKTQPEA